MPSTDDVCSEWFTFECTERSCCESYHMRFVMLLFSIGMFLLALLVAGIWLLFEFRPAYRNRLRRRDEPSEIELKSSEETRYLRRMSEMKATVVIDVLFGGLRCF
ncbi:hypothetical protein L596_003144 [Steinernema carpocapsae]|uniref:Uncharacterized protein n=1 Tax=Steinernema carpocapsae TaxID=34508 RepID=A0A4U8URN6_STECR|nr:hypothetical protein L596_003144 [Steinernema carpocapsae]